MAFQRFRWIILLLVTLIEAPAPLLALQPSPTSGDTQLYIGHSARLTAQIPADWEVMANFGFAYGGDGTLFISDFSTEPTLVEACDATVEFYAEESVANITETTWRGNPACEIDIPSSILGGIPFSAMVMTHPVPFSYQGQNIIYTVIVGTPENFESILPTVSFDISNLTGPEIAHSILEFAEVNTFYTEEVDWEALHAAADDLTAPEGVSSFIKTSLLGRLRHAGDNHSFLMANIDETSATANLMGSPLGEMRGNLGYIDIPSGAMPADEAPYVEAGLGTVATLDQANACGWIVDLRGNRGGGVPVMIQSLLPFFPEDRLVGFMDATGTRSWVTREGNRLLYEQGDRAVPYGPTFDTPLPDIADPDAPIAVLVNRHTLSAAEFTLLALMGRSHTQAFGQNTGGLTTGNAGFVMLDGTTLALAGAAAIDREGNVYTGPITPDVETTSLADGGAQGQDETITTAEAWLLEQPACQDAATPAP